jgi:hypothetical protein
LVVGCAEESKFWAKVAIDRIVQKARKQNKAGEEGKKARCTVLARK